MSLIESTLFAISVISSSSRNTAKFTSTSISKLALSFFMVFFKSIGFIIGAILETSSVESESTSLIAFFTATASLESDPNNTSKEISSSLQSCSILEISGNELPLSQLETA